MVFSKHSNKVDSVRIISDTFAASPSVNIVIGDKGNRIKKINRLAEFAFIKAFNRYGAYLSDNKKGVALCFSSSYKAPNLNEYYHEFRFAFSIPVSKVIQTLKREAYIKKHRINKAQIYCSFFQVSIYL
jgi:hypothetical protein